LLFSDNGVKGIGKSSIEKMSSSLSRLLSLCEDEVDDEYFKNESRNEDVSLSDIDLFDFGERI
jgi:hypothetical protein